MKVATGSNVLKAYNKAAKNLVKDTAIVSSEVTAGMLITKGQPRGKRIGYQVFVRICKWDEQLQKKKPLTGGLLENVK